MESALIFSQTLFYLVISIAIIVLGVLSSLVVFNLVKITRQLENISRNFQSTSSTITKQIEDIIDQLATLPFLNFFFKKHRADRDKNDEYARKNKKIK
jgi:hypothetical protein